MFIGKSAHRECGNLQEHIEFAMLLTMPKCQFSWNIPAANSYEAPALLIGAANRRRKYSTRCSSLAGPANYAKLGPYWPCYSDQPGALLPAEEGACRVERALGAGAGDDEPAADVLVLEHAVGADGSVEVEAER